MQRSLVFLPFVFADELMHAWLRMKNIAGLEPKASMAGVACCMLQRQGVALKNTDCDSWVLA